MPTIRELRERQAVIVTEGRARIDQITAATDEARAAELNAQHDAALAEYDRIQQQIEREERQARLEQQVAEFRASQRPGGGDRTVPATETVGGDEGDAAASAEEYRAAFQQYIRAGGEIALLSAEHRTVLHRGYAAPEQRAQSVGTNTAGGYTVPVTLADFIIKTMKDWGPMYDEAICTVLTTSSGNGIPIPTIDDTGNTAAIRAENAAMVDDGSGDATFGQKRLDAYVYATPFVKFSMELAADSVLNMETFIASLLGERLARIANGRLTVGTGSSQPNGVVTAVSAGKTAAAVGAIAGDEVIDLVHSVNAAYRRSPKARFMFADGTLAVLRKLKDGQGNYLWQMGDVSKGQPGTLLGYNYSINDDVPAIGASAKSILFGDFSRYYVRKVGAPIIGTMRERFWPDLGLAGVIRFDGELGDTAAIKALAHPAS